MSIFIAPLPPRGWRRLTAGLRLLWRRARGVDLDDLPGWTDIGYLDDDGLNAEINDDDTIKAWAGYSSTITFALDDVSTRTLSLFYGSGRHRDWTRPIDGAYPSPDGGPEYRIATSAMWRRFFADLPRPAHRKDDT